MENLLQGKLSLMLAIVIWVSRTANAIAGSWGRVFPPINTWPCPPFFGWNQGWFSLLLTALFWAAGIGLCALLIKRLFFFSVKGPYFGISHPYGPLDFLKQLYSREVSRQEVTFLRKDLPS